MAISPARKVAFDVLLRVETEAAYASDLLYSRLEGKPRGKALKPEDAGLATELTLGVLRWQRRLDDSIDAHLKKKQLDAPVRVTLRLGAYQLLFLDRIPAHAAVDESVELAKYSGKQSAGGLVNAVLRKVAAVRQQPREPLKLPATAGDADRLAIQESHPTWLVERWLARFSKAETTALLAANNAPASTCLSLSGSGNGVETLLESRLMPGNWLSNAFRLAGGYSEAMSQLPLLLDAGMVSFQDEASRMVAHLVEPRRGHCVLDVCAAPGGKTMMLAQAVGDVGGVVATDLHWHRLASMRRRLLAAASLRKQLQGKITEGHAAACGAPRSPIELAAVDATRPLPFGRQFDRVLVDVPCSGTGTLARNPEIRWRLKAEDLLDLAARQRAILANALDAVAPGGRLVYSTCSLEPEENEQVVEAVISARADAKVIDGRAALVPHLREGADVRALFDERGYFRTFPPRHGTDGFFAAVIQKNA